MDHLDDHRDSFVSHDRDDPYDPYDGRATDRRDSNDRYVSDRYEPDREDFADELYHVEPASPVD